MREPTPPPFHSKLTPDGPPLAAAASRLKGVRGRPKVSSDLVIGMKAAGVPQTKIAQVLDVNVATVDAALNRVPDAREQIATYREKLKLTKIERANRLEGRMWERLDKEVTSGDARDVDAIARALLASEKIQAGVSGEGAASGATQSPPAAVDLKILINQLLAK